MYEDHLSYIKKCLCYQEGTFIFHCKLNELLENNKKQYILLKVHSEDAYLSISKVGSTKVIYRCYLPEVGLRELFSTLSICEKIFFALSWDKNKISLWTGAVNKMKNYLK